MKIICVIPARLASKRLERKILAPLHGRPLIQWVWEAATSTDLFNAVYIAVDALETAEVVTAFGGNYLMTSPECLSGTERVVEIYKSKKVEGDLWVNWQGDEPFIPHGMLLKLIEPVAQRKGDVYTLKKAIQSVRERDDPNVVKVVANQQGKALYFSRCPIPYNRVNPLKGSLYKHIGIYAFTSYALEMLALSQPTPLERTEGLEQLRFLENGLTLHVEETHYESKGIDTLQHLREAQQSLARKGS